MKQEFLCLEYDYDSNTMDDEISNKINSQLDILYKNYKIIDYKVNILNSIDRDVTEKVNYPIIFITILVEFSEYKQ